MSTHVGTCRWSAWPTVLALFVAVGLTACSDSSSSPLGVDSLNPETSSTSGMTAASHTAGTSGANTVDLLAGQDIDVGDVTLTDDGTDLTVEITMEGDWCLTEVHIHAADSEDGIPQNKKGNPIPGQFEINEELTACESDLTRSLSLPEDPDNDGIVVAVHTVVHERVRTQVFQIGDVEVASSFSGDNSNCAGDCSDLTLLENYSDEFNQPDPNGPHTLGPSLGEEEPPFVDPFVVGTSSESSFPYNSNAGRGYATDFDVQWDGALPDGGELIISWSPGNSANETKTVSGDGVSATTFTAQGTVEQGEGWFLNQYKLVQHTIPVSALGDGTHTINFTHTTGDGTFWDWIRLVSFVDRAETAWGDGTRFVDRGNWATYITYVSPSCPAVTSASKVDLLEAPLGDVRAGANVDPDPQVFAESVLSDHGGFTLDIDASNNTNVTGDPAGFPVADGETVCSYYVHYDRGGVEASVDAASLTFESEIRGLIVAGTTNSSDIFHQQDLNTLCDTDAALGSEAVTYEMPGACGIDGDARGLEIFDSDPTLSSNQDPIQISTDAQTVTFSPAVFNKHDSFRVIVNPVGEIVEE